MSEAESFPTQAQVVIIGGGVIGCSVAYHLTKRSWRDLVLLERKDLTCGTTRHAAGLVVSGTFTSTVMSDMSKHNLELYQRLEKETGQDTGFRKVGYLELASSREWLEGFRWTRPWPWPKARGPAGFKFDELTLDWDRMMPYLEPAMERIPVAETAGIHRFFCGPESFTPDLEPFGAVLARRPRAAAVL
jgi:glycine/D-amino acid oxidase-like deaminating enzyme